MTADKASVDLNTTPVQGIEAKSRGAQRQFGVMAPGIRQDIDQATATFFDANTHGVKLTATTELGKSAWLGVKAYEVVGTVVGAVGILAEGAKRALPIMRHSKARSEEIYKAARAGRTELEVGKSFEGM